MDRAQWAEVPRAAYVRAARFLVEHNVAYCHLHVDEAQAEAQFVEVGQSCEAIRAQATAVECEESMPVKLSGPADVGLDQDLHATTTALSVAEAEEGVDDDAENLGHGSEEDSAQQHCHEIEDEPGFRCVAGEVNSDDLDVERVLKEFAAKLKLLMSRGGGPGSNSEIFEKDMDSFRRLAESMSAADLQDKLNKLVAQMDHAEGLRPMSDGRKAVQVVHTGSVPLSMYSPEYWQKCFPEMFPYGDGVYGILRDAPLTFREWASYLLERTELEYDDEESGVEAWRCGPRFRPPSISRWAGDLNFFISCL